MSEKQNRPNRFRRSKLAKVGAGLAVAAVAAAGAAELSSGSSEPIIPKDHIVQVEGKTQPPAGFKAERVAHKKILRELDGANGWGRLVEVDTKGSEGIYQFSIPLGHGFQQVDYVGADWQQVKHEFGTDVQAYQSHARTEIISSRADTAAEPKQYLLMQVPDSPHPLAVPVGATRP